MTDARDLDRPDKAGMYLSIAVVTLAAVLAIVNAVRRLVEVGDGSDVPVTVPLTGETAALPLGPDGAALEATVETATVIVPDPAPATLFALYAEPVWIALMVVAGVVFAAMFFLRLARGLAFERGTSRLVYVAAGVLLAGWFVGSIITNMTVHGALSAVSDYTYDSVSFEVSLLPFFVYLVVGAFAAALQIGERLQRDTEGLV